MLISMLKNDSPGENRDWLLPCNRAQIIFEYPIRRENILHFLLVDCFLSPPFPFYPHCRWKTFPYHDSYRR